jgi:hypothetical protein
MYYAGVYGKVKMHRRYLTQVQGSCLLADRLTYEMYDTSSQTWRANIKTNFAKVSVENCMNQIKDLITICDLGRWRKSLT